MQAESLSLRILYVEDHADTAEVFARSLELMGYTVQIAPDSATALTLAISSHFDLLLCDIVLPDGDGCSLLRNLRQNPRLENLRAIAFSGLGTCDDINRIKAAGFDGHVLKPVEPQELHRMIERVCRARANDAAAGATTRCSAGSCAPPSAAISSR
jgi:CheY-like chemotaxis protein